MAVITMSRQVGSGAEEIAEQLRSELGLTAFDKRLMLRVASELGVSESEIIDYSEDQYKLRGFFDALFRRSRPIAETTSWTGGSRTGYERQVSILDEDRAIDLVRSTINAAYDRGNVLIIGRGGQAILENRSGVFHVRIVAPFEYRLQRIQVEEHMTAAQARRYIQERDRATAEYLRHFHNIDVDDPTLYHMVLNTGLLTTRQCAKLIKMAIEQMEQGQVGAAAGEGEETEQAAS